MDLGCVIRQGAVSANRQGRLYYLPMLYFVEGYSGIRPASRKAEERNEEVRGMRTGKAEVEKEE